MIAKTLAVATAVVIVSVLSITLYVWHYGSVNSPQGFNCWNEVNASQPFGVEKICEVQS